MQMLESVFSKGFGLPNAGAGSSNQMGQMFGHLKDFMDQERMNNAQGRLNVDPLRDIEPFRVNPFRGFLSQHGGPIEGGGMPMSVLMPSAGLLPGGGLMDSLRGQIQMKALQDMQKGGMAGSLPSLPASIQLDTINNTPSNLPGGSGGKFDLSQLALQPNNTFVIPKNQPFSDPIFGNKLLDIDNKFQPAAFQYGGYPNQIPHALFGGLFKSIGKGIGSVGKGLFKGVKQGLGAIGDVASAVSPIASLIPGLGLFGTLAGPVGGLLGQLNDSRPQQPTGGMFQGPFSGGAGPFGGLQSMMGQNPFGGIGTSFGGGINPFGGMLQAPTGGGGGNPFAQLLQQPSFGVPGFAGGMFGIPRFQEGGPVNAMANLIPIQAEKVGKQPEMIIHPDFTITPVNATTSHAKMDDDEVTDMVVEGSYIASADKSMKISYKDADEIVIGIKHMPYKERKQGKVPEEITLASLWGSKDRKDKTFAELAKLLSKRIKVVDKGEYFEYGNDIFTQLTNKANLETRLPYISQIVGLNEEQRPADSNTIQYKHGGKVRMPNVRKAGLGDIISTIGAAAPGILSALGIGGSNPQNPMAVSPEVQYGILGSLPMYQMGLNQNIAAQQQGFNQGRDAYGSLGQNLIQNAMNSAAMQQGANLGTTALGLMNQMGMETNLPQLDLGSIRARANNFRPRAMSRNAIEAMSTPNFDANAIMSTMGRGAGPMLAQLMSKQMGNQNQLAMQRNQQLDQYDMQRNQILNNADLTEQQFNIGQAEKERMLREQQRGGIFGTLGQGLQRGADLGSGMLGQIGNIQSSILPQMLQQDQLSRQLTGQNLIGGAQNALNAFSILGGLQGQAALGNAMYPQTQPQGTGFNMADAVAQLVGPKGKTKDELAKEQLLKDREAWTSGILPGILPNQPLQGLGGIDPWTTRTLLQYNPFSPTFGMKIGFGG